MLSAVQSPFVGVFLCMSPTGSLVEMKVLKLTRVTTVSLHSAYYDYTDRHSRHCLTVRRLLSDND
jgi:hypothetical protein